MPEKKNKQKSNLSETAKFVKKVMDEVIMPEIEKRGFAAKANQIILERPGKDSEGAIEFSLQLREIEDECIKKISEDDPEKKRKETVSKNFCKKLRSAVESVER